MTVEEKVKQMLQREESLFDKLQQKAKDEHVFRIKNEIREQAAMVKRKIVLLKELLNL